MASIELTPLNEHLDDEEIEALNEALMETGADRVDIDDRADPVLMDGKLDDDIFADFLDRLDANDAACDIYVPSDFEEILDLAGHRVGSVHALLVVLESIKDDFFVEDEDEDEDEGEDDDGVDYDDFGDDDSALFEDHEESAIELKDEELRQIWRLMYRSARTALARRIALFIHT